MRYAVFLTTASGLVLAASPAQATTRGDMGGPSFGGARVADPDIRVERMAGSVGTRSSGRGRPKKGLLSVLRDNDPYVRRAYAWLGS